MAMNIEIAAVTPMAATTIARTASTVNGRAVPAKSERKHTILVEPEQQVEGVVREEASAVKDVRQPLCDPRRAQHAPVRVLEVLQLHPEAFLQLERVRLHPRRDQHTLVRPATDRKTVRTAQARCSSVLQAFVTRM